MLVIRMLVVISTFMDKEPELKGEMCLGAVIWGKSLCYVL